MDRINVEWSIVRSPRSTKEMIMEVVKSEHMGILYKAVLHPNSDIEVIEEALRASSLNLKGNKAARAKHIHLCFVATKIPGLSELAINMILEAGLYKVKKKYASIGLIESLYKNPSVQESDVKHLLWIYLCGEGGDLLLTPDNISSAKTYAIKHQLDFLLDDLS